MTLRRVVAGATAVVLAASLVSSFAAPIALASAATNAQTQTFDAGNIISDALFFDGASMSSEGVQAFLNSQVASCRSGYVCLKDYRQATSNRAADGNNCAAYSGSGDESAAQIIAKVGQACGISQKAIIVLLQKEQGLVTDTWPTSGQYRSATGYGCPDTAACDSLYYGFFNQIYSAALQFKYYAANPTRWNHIAGRVNNIRYHPNASCGTSPVFIQNQATAGLYNYTPYQPNAAALNDLYGTGDACSAYGNRNFWRMYTDWFGTPTGASNLARTVDNPSVFLTSGTVKYPVTTMALLNDLTPLGAVGYVSQNYLDSFQTVQNAGRAIRANSGDIFYLGANQKLKFDTCGLVADYIGSCSLSALTQLTDAQVAAFPTGPAMTPIMGTREEATYYVTSGTKREILDDQSRIEANLPSAKNILLESTLVDLSFGPPVIRESALVTQRNSSNSFLLAGGSALTFSADTASILGVPGSAAGSLWPQSIAKIPTSGTGFTGVVRGPTDTSDQVLVQGGRYSWPTASVGNGIAATPVAQAFLAPFPSRGSLTDGNFLKSATDPSVYFLAGTTLRKVNDWPALLSLSQGAPNILTVPSGVVSYLPKGPLLLASNTLVRTADDPTVFLLNGITNKIPLSSFDMAIEAGIATFSYVAASSIQGYPTAPQRLGYGLVCGASNYVAAGGGIHLVSPERVALYPMSYQTLDAFSCSHLTIGNPVGQFIRTSDGTIYQLAGGQRHRILTMDRYNQLGGPAEGYLSVSAGFAGSIPEGPAA